MRKKTYVSGLIDSKPPTEKKSKNEVSKRNQTFNYFLEVDGSRVQVCQTMFLNTLDLKQSRVYKWKNNAIQQASNPALPPLLPNVKTVKQRIAEDFVNSLPRMPSHYCRSRSKKVYLTDEVKTQRDLARSFNTWCARKTFSLFLVTKYYERK